nr:helix-turn-helix transcriptional regulator [Thaumasiovibrio subtropicus]
MSIGEVLKDRRLALSIKQEDIAEQMNVTVQTVSKWERGVTEPKARDVSKLAEILLVTEGEICRGELNSANVSKMDFMKKIASIKMKLDDVAFFSTVYDYIPDKKGLLDKLEHELLRQQAEEHWMVIDEAEKENWFAYLEYKKRQERNEILSDIYEAEGQEGVDNYLKSEI